jgi:hypothetical protein
MALDDGLLDHRNPERRGKEQLGSAKRRRGHANDRELVLVDLDRLPHNTGIALKMAMPVRVTQHHVGSAVRAVLIGSVKKTPELRLNAHRVEVVAAREVRPRSRWIPAGIHAHGAHDVVRDHALERPIPVAQIHIIGIRLRRVLQTLNHVEILRIRHIDRPQHQRVQHAEHHRVRANPQRQRQDRRHRKSR